MTRIIISLAVLIVLIVGVIYWFRHKKSAARGNIVAQLKNAGFEVDCQGFVNHPGSTADISAVRGVVRTYALAAEVDGIYVRSASSDYGHLRPRVTFSTSLRHEVPEFSMRGRSFIHGADRLAASRNSGGSVDEGAVAVGNAQFDDAFLLYCENVRAARRYIGGDFARLLSADGRSREFLKNSDILWVAGGSTGQSEICLRLDETQVEKIDILSALDYVAFLAETLDKSALAVVEEQQ